MGPEQFTVQYVDNDLTLIDAAELRDWIMAVAGKQVLNKPWLVANTNRVAKLLVSETGLGVPLWRQATTSRISRWQICRPTCIWRIHVVTPMLCTEC